MQVANTKQQQMTNLVIHTIHGGPRIAVATQLALRSHHPKATQVR